MVSWLFAFVAALGWMTAGQAPAASLTTNTAIRMTDPVNDREAVTRIEALVQAAEAGEPTAQKAYEAAELGLSALWAASTRLDPEKPSHRGPLLILAEQVSNVRKTQRELLRLYDPSAYRAFYTPEGVRLQTWLASALTWENPPPNMPRVMVMAAPDPTIAWLEAQDDRALKTPGLLIEILGQWGSLAAMGREYQYLPRLNTLAQRLTESPAVRTDEPLLRAVLQFIGDAACRDGDSFVADALGHATPAVRRIAAATLGRLRGDTALQALTDRAGKESDPVVQTAIAGALLRWPAEPEAGEACQRLYGRAANADVRRAVLNAAAFAQWPAREPLVRRAFEAGDGAALIALAAKPVPGLDVSLLERLQNHEGQFVDPYLLDAVVAARPAGAVPLIAGFLRQEKNVAMRLKYVSALEAIGGNAAGATLLKWIDGSKEAMETEFVITSLGRMRFEPAVSRLAQLAKDANVEISMRVQAIWALGRMQNEQARSELAEIEKMLNAPDVGFFPSADAAFHFRLVTPHLLLARLRFDRAAAGDKIQAMFDEGWPIKQATLLAGLAEQQIDHPIIAAGMESSDFAVFYMAITAARASNPAKYGPRVRRLAMSPYIQALAEISLETWDLKSLLTEGWR